VQYNFEMADRIACSCVTCPKCGSWVVVRQQPESGENKRKLKATCPAPDCGKEFEFETDETRLFEVPLPLFERRHFYRSQLT
jgi:DNA-directed RNA polymerase subunit RPC12/RpoP